MKIQNPKGMRDYSPKKKKRMDFILGGIKKSFELYGFEPLETPAMEYAKLLEGKYGEDEKLIYKFKDKGNRWLAMRFDQTAPLARYITQNPQIPKPFKRYVIGKAWRYENPQKSRYREFYQADIDIVGSEKLIADAEVIACANDALKRLGFQNMKTAINNRKLMDEILKKIGIKKTIEALRAIDKMDKVGINGVKNELKKRGVKKIERILDIISIKGDNKKKLGRVREIVNESPGLKELKELFKYLDYYKIDYEFDLTLSRGLDYYTGPVFEVRGEFGSIAGGGRYDKLIGKFTGNNIPATGIAFGPDRILDLMEELKMFEASEPAVKVFIAKVGKVEKEAISVMQKLRGGGIACEIDYKDRTLSKQLDYANKKNIPLVLIIGESDLKIKEAVIKLMESGEEKRIKISSTVKKIKSLFGKDSQKG